jgi:hypothetical protein
MLGLRLPAMGRYTNPTELRLAGCADQHGYDAEFESDWAARFDPGFETDPDFLIARDRFEAIVEVRIFGVRVRE